MRKLIVLLAFLVGAWTASAYAEGLPADYVLLAQATIPTTSTSSPATPQPKQDPAELGKPLNESELRDIVVLLRDYALLQEKVAQLEELAKNSGGQTNNLQQQIDTQKIIISQYETIIRLYEQQINLYQKNLDLANKIADKEGKRADDAEKRAEWLKWAGPIGFILGIAATVFIGAL